MNSREIREGFLSFFEERDHRRVASASVVPGDDPTLYFTNAGMNQFKDVFLGLGSRGYARAVDSQKCIRVSGKHNDLEEVGRSPRHHTFFEMLGNWSFGDYFKKEAIEWAWQLLTEVWGLDKDRLWGTVFAGDEADGLEADDEAQRLWGECTDLPANRVVKLPAKDVFWEMGETGPCGPSSELHYYLGSDLSQQTPAGLARGDADFLEIWNLVFIQFNRDANGALHPLPARHVDTGMGFERICSIIQDKSSNYETDVFYPLIERIAELSGRPYTGEDAVAMQVIADHVRALTFAIADGALPSNEGAGYVLRRILRRASRYGRNLGQMEPFIGALASSVGDIMGDAYPEVVEKANHIALVIRSEEEGFGATLDRGLEIFEKVASKGEVTGDDAFLLHDTYGFPLDLTELMARERGLAVDTAGFDRELAEQRRRARAATREQHRAASGDGQPIEGNHSNFVGYDELEIQSEVVNVDADDEGLVKLFLTDTSFYAESGGQVGDSGRVIGDGFELAVEQTLRARGGIAHIGHLSQGSVAAVGGQVRACVDETARLSAARNHTATHLFHEVLRQTLGDHVAQMGSLVSPSRLRFDFSHFSSLDANQIDEIEDLVNEQIRADFEVTAFEEEISAAKQMGARALFGEKYGDRVRVVKIADFSLELCGGTHVKTTGQIGMLSFVSEGGIAAGTRRAEALTGIEAIRAARVQRHELAALRALMNSTPRELSHDVSSLLESNRELERKLTEARRGAAGQTASELIETAVDVGDARVVAARVEVSDADSMRSMADGLRGQLGTGAAVLGSILEGKVTFIAVVTDDLAKTGALKAGDIVREVAQLAGGSGGGKPHMAQAGGGDADKLDGALAAAEQIVRARLDK
jgi:alanyl-tRNA synthetase